MTAHTAAIAWFSIVIGALLIGWAIEEWRERPKRNKRGSNLPPPDASCAREYSDNFNRRAS